MFCAVAADTRAAGTDPASQRAFIYLMLGLHENESSADRFLEDQLVRVPWMSEASELYGAVLQPYRHKGEANYLNRTQPGQLFGRLAACPSPDAPFVSMTTSGWTVGDQLDMNRVREFSTGVLAIRASMTAVPGLHSQQSFFFPGVLALDPLTVTFWRNDAAIRAFSYGPGVHRHHLDRHRAENLADRTSFTRFQVLRSVGTWYGINPNSSDRRD
jgi:hypothetical protein